MIKSQVITRGNICVNSLVNTKRESIVKKSQVINKDVCRCCLSVKSIKFLKGTFW